MVPTLLGGRVYSGLWLGRWERKWVTTGSDMAEAGGQGFCPLISPVLWRWRVTRRHGWEGPPTAGMGARLQDTGGCCLLPLTQAASPQINLGGVACLAALFWGLLLRWVCKMP